MSATAKRFEQFFSVQAEEIDAFNHVNNVVYLRWVQEISTAHWNAAATESQKSSIGWVVVRHEIDYKNSARLGDEIIACTWVGTAKKNIFERYTEFLRMPDLKVLVQARTLWCPISLQTLRPTRVDKEIHARFSAQ